MSDSLKNLKDAIDQRLERAQRDGALPLDILLMAGIYYELVEQRARFGLNEVAITEVPRRGPGRPRKTTQNEQG